jgi:hypothetical protein
MTRTIHGLKLNTPNESDTNSRDKLASRTVQTDSKNASGEESGHVIS